MNKPVSVDFQFSIKQRGRGAKKRIVEGASQSDESKPALERIPRISRYMALAIHFEDLIRQGVVTDYADLARLGHVTRARVTQIMNLRLLAPEIQEELLLSSSDNHESDSLSLKVLQQLAMDSSWESQRKKWITSRRTDR
ncbi:MAG: hypothetical protein NTV29_04425 [Planctomycetota bacterium]|jgi:hypothetical protein|nr:hypothetical protein [Planctomycetota bacterium]